MEKYFDGELFLKYVTEKLKLRMEEIERSLTEGQKEIENMQEYYWENYAEMDLSLIHICIRARLDCIHGRWFSD